MALIAAYITPHPPLAVSDVGRGRELEIQQTIDGFESIASSIAKLAPETIVIISPHTAYYADCIFLAGGTEAHGDLSQFGAPDVRITLAYDAELRSQLALLAKAVDVPVAVIPPDDDPDQEGRPLDHGIMVPLSFVGKRYPPSNYQAVSIGGSALPREKLLAFGRCIATACERSGKRCVLLVSGDLSHKLKDDGPYGFDPAGPIFDIAFQEVVRHGDPMGFAELDEGMCEDAAECGLSGFIMMAGALRQATEDSGIGFSSCLISHEGPFGVGYGVASFEREDALVDNSNIDSLEGKARISGFTGESADPLVALARETINRYVTSGKVPDSPILPPSEPDRSGCFVSIHTASTDELRGCIGTIAPVQDSLAEEIIANAISASTRDPRFPPIAPEELGDLDISVDVLFPPEPATLDVMDPARYGIIVTQGFKRGLLLPDLDGVDTVEQQFCIACSKAGIDPRCDPSTIDIERFEVVRHE